jgi:predicted transcriptional regulator
MHKHGYSQLPVVHNGEVIGVFSYRSFAQKAARESLDDWAHQKCAPGDLPVDDCIEKFEFARVTEDMSHCFDAMDRDNGILIGAPEGLIGILTPMNFLRGLYRVASPFVMEKVGISPSIADLAKEWFEQRSLCESFVRR